MDTYFHRHPRTTLATLLIAQVLLLAMQVKRPAEDRAVSLLHYWGIKLITPLEKGFVHTGDFASNAWHNYFYLRGVRKENEQLKQQLEDMRLQQVRLQEDANQARRIQALLAFKEQFISKTVAAQVIGTSGTDLSRILYIDRGAGDGIKPDMAVITGDGVVGKVLKVMPGTSQVLEINDQTSGVGALLTKTRLQGIAKGTPGGSVTLNNIMADEQIQPGDQVVTSGGDRIFPKGLPIGTVGSVSPGRDVFLEIKIKPAANLSKVEEVLIVTEVVNKEPDTKDLGPIRASDILAERLPTVTQKPAEGEPLPHGGVGAQPQKPANPQGSAPTAQPNKATPGATTPAKPATGGVAAKPGTTTAPAAPPKSNAQGTAPAAPKQPDATPKPKPKTPANPAASTPTPQEPQR